MKEKIKKAIRRAYNKGRKEGFDKGMEVANMVYADIVAEKIREIEKLNSELILGEEEDDDQCRPHPCDE